VGRENEVATLLRCWSRAKDGEGQVVLVCGEAGIGKSRLAHIVREQISEGKHKVVRCQCSPYYVNSALFPVIAQLERAARFNREDSIDQKLDKLETLLSVASGELSGSIPLYAALLSLPTDRYSTSGLSPRRKKENTLNALASR